MSIQWQSVESGYKTHLQIRVLIDFAVFAMIGAGFYLFSPSTDWLPAPLYLGVPWAILALFFGLFWAPRRYQLTGYAESSEAMYLRRGAMWRSSRAVPLNRIQHVEMRQGVIERALGLSRLSIYTAGSGGADLSIPGLKVADAERMKQQLMQSVASEELEADQDDE